MADRIICKITIKEEKNTNLTDLALQEIKEFVLDKLRCLPHHTQITWKGDFIKTTKRIDQ